MVIKQLLQRKKKQLAILIDPDKTDTRLLQEIIEESSGHHVDFFLAGGSFVDGEQLSDCIAQIKKQCNIPVILFPGSVFQTEPNADAILLLSLISGRNPELLIGNHVAVSQKLRNSKLEIIPTGYILIEGGSYSAVEYISGTRPVPSNQYQIGAATALAGQQLGLQVIYLEAGSGALHPVSPEMIKHVKQAVDIPVIVGGGITSGMQCRTALKAGADIIVVGNAVENNPALIRELSETVGGINNS